MPRPDAIAADTASQNGLAALAPILMSNLAVHEYAPAKRAGKKRRSKVLISLVEAG